MKSGGGLQFALLILFGLFAAGFSFGASGLIWPTPNDAFMRGEPIEAFVQPTVSGKVESGLYGCVRNNGSRFHEGLDLFPVRRGAKGIALDEVFAVLPGRVTYVNTDAGHSNYGRYVVIVHENEEPAFYTLYAHLASVARGIRPGVAVEAGTVLGIMGNTPGHIIPVSRSHLHFEMGFRITDDFQKWYQRQNFGSPNRHGVWNGMNLAGVNPLDYYTAYREGRVKSMADFLARDPAVARVEVLIARIPSFVGIYPSLLTSPLDPDRELAGWSIVFDRYGIPKAWTPLYSDQELKGNRGEMRLTAYNPKLEKELGCRAVVNRDKEGRPVLSPETIGMIRKLFVEP